MTRTDAQIWEVVQQWLDVNKPLIRRAYNKWGWIHGATLDDTTQEMALQCFKCIRLLERDAIAEATELDWDELLSSKLLKKKVMGNYHVEAWRNRTDDNIRMSDIYNIEPGGDDDCGVSSASVEDMETCGLFTLDSYSDEEDEAEPHFYGLSEEDIQEICQALLSILPEKRRGLIEQVYLGGDEGFLTHEEAAETTDITRSAVTKSLKTGREILTEFCKANKLSLDMPLDKFKEKLMTHVKIYRRRHGLKDARFQVKQLYFGFIDLLETIAPLDDKAILVA